MCFHVAISIRISSVLIILFAFFLHHQAAPAGGTPPMKDGASGGLAGVNRGPPPRDGPGPDTAPPITLQGGSLKTWSMPNAAVQSVQVFMETEGRPLDANLE